MQRSLSIFAVALLALSCFTASASAEDIDGGHLFAVVSQPGGFSGTASEEEEYAVFHLIEYAPTPPSVFPEHLVPMFFPALFDPFTLDLPLPGKEFTLEFFLIGMVGVPDIRDLSTPDHLILSDAAGTGTNPFPQGPLHDELVAGTELLVGDPQYRVSAFDFWLRYRENDPSSIAGEFFGGPSAVMPVDPVRQLITFSFSEDLFGFEPPFDLGSITASATLTVYQAGDDTRFSSAPEPAFSALALTALAFLGVRLRRRRA